MDLIDFEYEKEKFTKNISELDKQQWQIKLNMRKAYLNAKRFELELKYFAYLRNKEHFETLKYNSKSDSLYIIKDNILYFNHSKFLELAGELTDLMDNLVIMEDYLKNTEFKEYTFSHHFVYIDNLDSGEGFTIFFKGVPVLRVDYLIYNKLKLYSMHIEKSVFQMHCKFIDWFSKNLESFGYRKPRTLDEINLFDNLYKNDSKRIDQC